MHPVIRSTIISFILEDFIVFLRAKVLQLTSLVLIRKHSRTKDKLIKETIESLVCKVLKHLRITDATCCAHLFV